MGRYIDMSKPLTIEDRTFLLERSRGDEVNANDQIFGHLTLAERNAVRKEMVEDSAEDTRYEAELRRQIAEDDENAFDEDLVNKVVQMTTNQIKTALVSLGVEPKDNKRDLMEQMLEVLQDERDAS